MIGLGIPFIGMNFDTVAAWFESANVVRWAVMVKQIVSADPYAAIQLSSVYMVYGFEDSVLAMQFRLTFDAKLIELDDDDLHMLTTMMNARSSVEAMKNA
jgi:hypothetical protein